MPHSQARIKYWLLLAAGVSQIASCGLALVSGLAMDDVVGSTPQSQDWAMLATAASWPACLIVVALLAAAQQGGILLRCIALLVTATLCRFLQLAVCAGIQLLAAP